MTTHELHWIETCDLCGDEYPMSWIIYTGAQFLCAACVTDNP